MSIILKWRYTPQVGLPDVTSLASVVGPRGLGIASESFDSQTGILTFTMTDSSTETVDFSGYLTALNTIQSATESARDLAQDWASKPQGQVVADGLFSALDRALAAAASATSAAGSAGQAATSLSEVQAIQTAINSVFDNFDDRYLGAFATADEPTVDNDGDPLLVGAIYWNTDDNELRFWNSTAWESPEATATLAAQQALAAQAASETAKADAEAARDASQAARDVTLGYRNEAEAHKTDAAQSASVATAAAAALVGTEGIIPTASEILWLSSKPQAGVNALGFFDTGARLLSGVSERALLRYGEDNDTLNFMLLDGGVDGVRLDFTQDDAVFSNAVGTVPVTPGSSLGLVLDQSGGLVLGVELAPNGGFDTDLAGWSARAEATVAHSADGGGSAEVTVTGSGGGVRTFLTGLSVNSFYLISFRMRLGTFTGTLIASLGDVTNPPVINPTSEYQTFSLRLRPPSSDVDFYIQRGVAATGTFYVDDVSIREIPGTHATQPNAALQGKFGKAPKVVRNLFTQTENLTVWSKQTGVTVSADAALSPNGDTTADMVTWTSPNSLFRLYPMVSGTTYTFSIYVKGVAGETVSVNLDVPSGVNDRRSVTLTGEWQRVNRVATSDSTANGVLAVRGDGTASEVFIWGSQLEIGSIATPYQAVGASDLDVTESGVQSFGFYRPDLSDDVLPLTVPAIDGDILIAGKKGIHIAAITASAGAFAIGPTTYTGGSAGVLAAVGDICGIELIDKTLSTEERARLVAYYQARGAGALL